MVGKNKQPMSFYNMNAVRYFLGFFKKNNLDISLMNRISFFSPSQFLFPVHSTLLEQSTYPIRLKSEALEAREISQFLHLRSGLIQIRLAAAEMIGQLFYIVCACCWAGLQAQVR